jgi:hypothetical protein
LPPGPQTLQGFNITTGAASNIVSTSGPTPVPEQGTLSIVAIGLGAVAIGIRRRMHV